MDNKRGITLISLIITIIVLSILITITIYSGDGTIEYADYNRAKNEIAKLQSNVNLWHNKYESIEVKDEEITNNSTKEQILQDKQHDFLEQYGVSTDNELCDQTELEYTIQEVRKKDSSINVQDFRFITAQFLKTNYGFGSSYDYLVNIKNKKIILFGGVEYNEEVYYTAEDFGIQNVEDSNSPNSISFNVQQGTSKEIVISNLKLYDKESVPSDISKFIIKYKKSSDNNWVDITNDITKELENNEITYNFKVSTVGTYDVIIYTTDKKIFRQNTVSIENIMYTMAFNLEQVNNKEIIIANLKFIDDDSNEHNITNKNNIIIKYKLSSGAEDTWTNVTSNVTSFIDNNNTKFKFSVPQVGEYDVKICTSDEQLYSQDDINIVGIPVSVAFNIQQEQNVNKYIIISNLRFLDDESNALNVNSFNVKYKTLLAGDDEWNDVTESVESFTDNNQTKYRFEIASLGDYTVRISTEDNRIANNASVRGIKIGDYITYNSPTASVTLSTAETGQTEAYGTQTLVSNNRFRILDIDSNGNLEIMRVVNLQQDSVISFRGLLGYNNIVYVINKKCNDLYKDDSKGITARSINFEDVTDRMIEGVKGESVAASTGKKKFEKYIDDRISNIASAADGQSVIVDTTNKTVTYRNGNTKYPDIFQYEEGGKIGDTLTGIPGSNPFRGIAESEIYSGYNGITTNTSGTSTNSLTVLNTFYDSVVVSATDFIDVTEQNTSVFYSMFINWTYYWLASRAHYCAGNRVYYYVRAIVDNKIHGAYFDSSLNNNNDVGGATYLRVCPIVYIPASVQINVSTDDSYYHISSPHQIQ